MNKKEVILFDGYCILCNNWVQFVLKAERSNNFYFSTLDSSFAKKYISNELNKLNLDTIVLLKDGKLFYKSDAVLQIIRKLKFPWSLLFVFIIIPKFLRNLVYDFIAKNRYKIFGKSNSCSIGNIEFKQRIIK